MGRGGCGVEKQRTAHSDYGRSQRAVMLPAARQTPTPPPPPPDARELLARSGISTSLREVLSAVLDARPEDPVAYICERLDAMLAGSGRVPLAHDAEALRRLAWTEPRFWEHAAAVFERLVDLQQAAPSAVRAKTAGDRE
ncbi:hypothetical protein HK405_002177, partial [Cladochytrium tenue]